MKAYRVNIPDENYWGVRFIQENFEGEAIINKSLKEFDPKIVFAWHCSIWIELDNVTEDGKPTGSEKAFAESLEEEFDKAIKGPDLNKPNAVFLAAISWNGSYELIWRVYKPELTNEYLSGLVATGEIQRSFDFRIEDDPEWKLAEWCLENV